MRLCNILAELAKLEDVEDTTDRIGMLPTDTE